MHSNEPANIVHDFDALLPAEMATKAEAVGVKKARLPTTKMFVLGVLAGAFIAFGGAFSTTVTAGAASTLPFGIVRLLAGVVFSVGLILVVVGGAELFTGNNLLVMAWANGKVTTREVLRNWGFVYVANFAGALGIAVLVFMSGQYQFGQGSVGFAAVSLANAKCNLGFLEATALGILCNVLVCLSVWLTFSARSVVDRVAVIVPPIACFVACGFEHSVANMYFIPLGILIHRYAPGTFWDMIGRGPLDFRSLTWERFVFSNLIPVTIGNVIGGAVMVGVIYWWVYLRPPTAVRP